MAEFEKYINNLEKEFEKNKFDNMSKASADEKLLYLYSYYHYFNGDNSKFLDIIQGNVINTHASDRIAGIYLDADSDLVDVDAIIVKYIKEKEDFNFPIELKALKDAENILLKTIKHQQCRKELADIISDEEYKFSSQRPLKIRLVTNYVPTAAKRRTIINALNALKPEQDYVSFHISFGLDIEYEILEIENPKEYVDDAVIRIDSKQNIVLYGTEKSLLVNISAKSLQGLYELYGYRGLFAQNLRYYVKNTKIDDNIINSITEKPDLFWYLNNGVIIICDDYIIDDNEILLSNFSIINGGQTTKLIGEADFDKDFYLQCKIIKNKYFEEEDKIAFIALVAEASNTQKPIKEKDLIANKPEQRMLKKQLAEAGIYCQIKRGEKVNKKIYPAAWQNTTNEELGQFLLSFVYQKPGIARSNKASICGNKERYNLIFEKKYNSAFLADLLKLKAFYKLWMNDIKKHDEGSDEFKVGLVNNGMFFTVAIIGVLCKLYYHEDYIDEINSSVISDQKIEVVSQHDIDHGFLNNSLDEEDFFSLFDLCYSYFYRPGYEFLKSFKGSYNNYSNFTKVDNNYKTYVFRQVCAVCMSGFPERIKTRLDGFFVKASEEELKKDKTLLSQYINVVSSSIGSDPGLSNDVVADIKEALQAYRTKTYKRRRIKAYEVFKNVACDRISQYAPTNIDDLRSLKCLSEYQLEMFGEDIVDVVSNVVNNR